MQHRTDLPHNRCNPSYIPHPPDGSCSYPSARQTILSLLPSCLPSNKKWPISRQPHPVPCPPKHPNRTNDRGLSPPDTSLLQNTRKPSSTLPDWHVWNPDIASDKPPAIRCCFPISVHILYRHGHIPYRPPHLSAVLAGPSPIRKDSSKQPPKQSFSSLFIWLCYVPSKIVSLLHVPNPIQTPQGLPPTKVPKKSPPHRP